MDVETDVLRWFQLVADGVTLTEVADLYGVSQPGVSRALARLEVEVGTPLLGRSGRVLRPTHAGSTFKRHVDVCMHGLDDGLAAVSQLVDPETGTVTIAFPPSLGTWLVPDLIGRFRLRYPHVHFRLQQSDDTLGSSLVAGGSVDLEFTARRPRSPAVHFERLFAQPLELAVPADHWTATSERRTVALADVADEAFVVLTPSWELRTLSDRLCAGAGFTPRVAFEATDLSVARGFVAAGLGVAIVPATDADRSAAGVVHRALRITDTGAHRDVGLTWSQDRRLLPSAELFRTAVLAQRRRLSRR